MGASMSTRSSRTKSKTINEPIQTAAAPPPDINFAGTFRLLDLPVDILTLILSFLSTESLITVRRTCKVLDAITFDRFADAYFAHIYCWVFTPKGLQRLKDILQISPRLRTRIRRLTLTDNPFEDQPHSALHVVQASDDIDLHPSAFNRGKYSMRYIPHECSDMMSTGLILMQRVLRDLKELPQDVSVEIDLTNHGGILPERHERAFQATLFSVTMSQTAIDSLAFDRRSLKHLDDILAHGRAELMASISTITSLYCVSEFWVSAGTRIESDFLDIVRAARQLRHLTFDITGPASLYDGPGLGGGYLLLQIPRQVWLAIDFSSLASLTLRHILFNTTEEDLSQIMTQCRPTLTHLTLSRIVMLANEDRWKCIGKVFLTMPGLVFLELHMIRSGEAWEDFTGFWAAPAPIFSVASPPGVRLEGRANVVKGLKELSYLGSSFFEQPNGDL